MRVEGLSAQQCAAENAQQRAVENAQQRAENAQQRCRSEIDD